jgi:hypothetical protein
MRARAQGVGSVSSLSVAIFGGTAPYLNAYLSGSGNKHLYTGYVITLGLVAEAAGECLSKESVHSRSHDGQKHLAGCAHGVTSS